ncbi:phospholipid phosphatase 1-like [Portunus trituberculatus]|uniref:phospholipid phosphatase 1-like n=1 Tax=Portunus trituberculatus TaxID=210409 RepID=UPI001E1D01A2|nr:phospholipid phosphatase 1-like [Portunus trituberculatus]
MAPSVAPSPLRPTATKEGQGAVDVEGAWLPETCCGQRRCGARRWGVCVNWLIYLSVFAGLAVLLLGVVAPSHTTITCSDPLIHREVKKETVPISLLFTLSFIVPFFKILIVEWVMPPASPSAPSKTPLRVGLRRAWRYLGDLFVGCLFMYFTTDLIKTVVGEARPNFWALCQPNLTDHQCSQVYTTVTWKDCTNPYKLRHWRLAETMKSFPSGHAAISVFSSLFIMAYTHKRLWRTIPSLVSPWLQLLWVIWTIVCCQSRVWDNKHFWWDVLAGALIGALFAFLTLHYLTNWFEREEEEEEEGDTALLSRRKEPTSPSPSPSSSSYIPEEEEEEGDNLSRFSGTSIKRLIGGAPRGRPSPRGTTAAGEAAAASGVALGAVQVKEE